MLRRGFSRAVSQPTDAPLTLGAFFFTVIRVARSAASFSSTFCVPCPESAAHVTHATTFKAFNSVCFYDLPPMKKPVFTLVKPRVESKTQVRE